MLLFAKEGKLEASPVARRVFLGSVALRGRPPREIVAMRFFGAQQVGAVRLGRSALNGAHMFESSRSRLSGERGRLVS